MKKLSKLENIILNLERNIQLMVDSIKLSDRVKKWKNSEREILINILRGRSKRYALLTGRYFITKYQEEY